MPMVSPPRPSCRRKILDGLGRAHWGRKGKLVQHLQAPTLAILRRKLVEAETGYSRSTLYLRMDQGLFTRPVKLGARAVGWPASEVAAINAARIAGKPESQIRELVALLERSRTERAADGF